MLLNLFLQFLGGWTSGLKSPREVRDCEYLGSSDFWWVETCRNSSAFNLVFWYQWDVLIGHDIPCSKIRSWYFWFPGSKSWNEIVPGLFGREHHAGCWLPWWRQAMWIFIEIDLWSILCRLYVIYVLHYFKCFFCDVLTYYTKFYIYIYIYVDFHFSSYAWFLLFRNLPKIISLQNHFQLNHKFFEFDFFFVISHKISPFF